MIDEPGGAEPTAPANTRTCRWKKSFATTAITCTRPITPTFLMPRSRRTDAVNRFDRLSRCSRASTSTARKAAARCRDTWTSTTRTTMAAAHATSTLTGPDSSFRRFVQDNDSALGLTVELISKSPCWKDTVIFVVEDDTQNGADHVDGHRYDLPCDQPLGEEAVRQQDPREPCERLQDRQSDPRDTAAQPVRRRRHRPARHVHREARLRPVQLPANPVRHGGEPDLAGVVQGGRLQSA